MTYAVPSRAVPSRAIIERARPSRAERITPVEKFFLDADLYGRMFMQSMTAKLPAVNGKYVERFGVDVMVGADTPRHTGNGLLIEGEGNARYKYSEDMTNTAISAGVTVSKNKITRTTDGPGYAGYSGAKSSATAMKISITAKVKKSIGDYLAVRLQGQYPARADVCFNLATGDISKAVTTYNGVTNAKAKIRQVANGYYKVHLTAIVDAKFSCIGALSPSTVSQNLDSSGSDAVADVEVAWLQIEEGEPSSYMPTNGAVVTRATEAGAADNGIWADSTDHAEMWDMLQRGVGTIHCRFRPHFNQADAPRNKCSVLSTRKAVGSILYFGGWAGRESIASTDGAHWSEYQGGWSADDILDCYIDFSLITKKFRLTVNGTACTECEFNGWNLSANRMMLAYGDLDGLALEILSLEFVNTPGWRAA